MASTAVVRLPEKIVTLFGPPMGSYLYRVARGGRGSGKSVGAATIALLRGYERRLRILCVRQFQNSIQESFYRELVDAMEQNPWLADQYIVTKESITGRNGTQFIFRGLDRNPQSIKSLAKIDLTIIEEAEDIPEASWINLEATVFRQPNSEMWVIYNPKRESTFDGGRWSGSPVDTRFIKNKAPRALVMDINWRDNPFFPENLETLRQRDIEAFDYATYAWIWEGAYLKNSKAQIFHDKFEVKTFEPGKDWDGPYQGLDWGYSQDPTAMIRAYIHDDCLWISHESGKAGIELDDVVNHVPCGDWNKYTTRADSAQPAMISHVRRKGMTKIEATKKGKGSVEDGIAFIRSFKRVYIHPRCRKTLNEFNTYSWKVDRQSGNILPDPVDANNHWLDALRYALEPIMRRAKVSYGWAV
jgi:phage terminase large subunit